ncbi:molybdopterin-dependent oxidoreductase, partial [Oceanidesulfovibrio marinus]|uniref:molybdopterin-dependent oxidoreductase n=1 Tax=Oceanidesulfovibrio marinus TaxID=370038 RepID=UPI00118487A6
MHYETRITTPLQRTGPKGSRQFAPIAWDDALDEVASQMRSVSEQHGPQAILPYSYAGHMGLIHRNIGQAFFNTLGASALDHTVFGP